MPEIGQWQQEHAVRLTVAIVSRGDLEANRSKAGAYGVRNVVLQQNREVAEAYEVRGTPSAVLIRSDGMIGSAVAAGADAIRGLVATATTARTPTVPMHNGNGSANGAVKPSLLGKPAPDVTLSTLDGEDVALSTMIGSEPTALLFWNPGCGYCSRMLDDLKVLEAEPAENAPKIVVISAGDAERNRAQRITSTLLLDPGFSAGRQFGASGTPSAVLIDSEGTVASNVAVGAPAVLALAGRSSETAGNMG